MANETKKIYIETAEKHLSKKSIKKQTWINDETLNKIKERKAAKSTSGTHSYAYKAIAKEVKQMCRKDKKNFLIEKCETIEDLKSKNRSREMYNDIKSLTKTFQPRLGVIKDENGKTLTESEKIADRWKRYCEDMFTNYQPTDEDQHRKAKVTEREEPNLPPLKTEIEWAIKSLKDRKSPGCDNIQAEMIKASG